MYQGIFNYSQNPLFWTRVNFSDKPKTSSSNQINIPRRKIFDLYYLKVEMSHSCAMRYYGATWYKSSIKSPWYSGQEVSGSVLYVHTDHSLKLSTFVWPIQLETVPITSPHKFINETQTLLYREEYNNTLNIVS